MTNPNVCRNSKLFIKRISVYRDTENTIYLLSRGKKNLIDGNLIRRNNAHIYLLLYRENFNLLDYSITIWIEFYDICEVVMKISEKFADSSRIVQVYTISTTGRYFWRCEGNIQIVHQEHETFSANTVAPL